MLKILRMKMRAILIATIAIIVPAFLFSFGLDHYLGRERPATVIARVDGEEIYYQQFYNAYREAGERQRAIRGEGWSKEIEKQVEKEVLEQLIRAKLLRQEAKRRRLRVNDKEVLEEIKSRPHFQREGKFDRNLYLRIMEFSRISPKDYEEEVRNDLRIRKLLRQVVEGATISDEELREAYVKRNERIRVQYLLFRGDDFKDSITINEDELKKYFQGRREKFRIPDRINAEYIMVSFRPEEMEVKEEEIVNYYQQHYKKEVPDASPEEPSPTPLEEVRAEIRDILANRKAEARARKEAEDLAFDLFDRIAWEAMVKEGKLKVKETGFFARGEVIKDLGWAPDFVAATFALEEDEVSEAIRTPRGYAICIVREKIKSYLPQLEEVKTKVEEAVRDKKARELARVKAEESLEKLKGGNDFQEVAKELSLEVKDSQFFSRGGFIRGIGFSPPFAETAFSLQEGGISPVVEVDQGFAILKMEAKEEIDEEKYALEAEEFRKTLLPWKQMEIYNQWYQALREGANIWIDPDFGK